VCPILTESGTDIRYVFQDIQIDVETKGNTLSQQVLILISDGNVVLYICLFSIICFITFSIVYDFLIRRHLEQKCVLILDN